MFYRKFVSWEAAPIEKVLQDPIPRALKAYDDGDKKPLGEFHIATTDPVFRLGGWAFDLRPYLRRYWVKEKYCGITEYWATNKTAIRLRVGSHNILKIVEVA